MGQGPEKFPPRKPRDPKLPEFSLRKLSFHELKRSELNPLNPRAKHHGLKLSEWQFLVSKNQLPSYKQQKKK